MNCLDAVEYLALHPDASEAPAVREAVDAHLRACPACAASAHRMAEAWKLLDASPDAPFAPDLVERVRARLREAADPIRPDASLGTSSVSPSPRLGPATRSRRWFPWAAAAALLLSATALWVVPSGSPPDRVSAALTPAEIAQIDAIQHLDLLENIDVAEGFDLLAADVPLDEAHRLIDLLSDDSPVEPSQEY